MNSLMTTTP